MNNFVLGIATFLILAGPCAGAAESPGAAAADETQTQVTLSGYFDGYYSYNFSRAQTNQTRLYDAYANQFTLNLAQASVDVKAGDAEMRADLDFGTYADLNTLASGRNGAPVDTSTRNVGEAIVRYKAGDSGFKFKFGKMYSQTGLENQRAIDDDHYSKSNLYAFAVPIWTFGFRVAYEVKKDVLGLMAGVYNGWNRMADNNNSKTVGFQARYSPLDSVDVTYNFLSGPEETGDDTHPRAVHELNVRARISPDLTASADGFFGSEDAAPINGTPTFDRWYGGFVSVKYRITDKFFVSPRYEIYNDEEGVTLPSLPSTGALAPQRITSATLTESYRITQNLETRLEERGDWSSDDSFSGGTGFRNSQATILAAVLFTTR